MGIVIFQPMLNATYIHTAVASCKLLCLARHIIKAVRKLNDAIEDPVQGVKHFIVTIAECLRGHAVIQKVRRCQTGFTID